MVRIIAALILATSVSFPVLAQSVSPADPASSSPPSARPASDILSENSPESYAVKPGDTLWRIAGLFLKDPWRWPDVWQLNQTQIKNPHRIYPGDIVYLDQSSGSPRLTVGKPVRNNASGQTLKLSPALYSEELPQEIPSIPANIIDPFISKPLIVDPKEHLAAPHIVATQEDRVFLGNGDTGFVSKIEHADIQKWHVYRPGKPLKDPETQEIIAHEAFFLGHAQLVKTGEPAIIRITHAKEEIGRNDRLVPAPNNVLLSYVPRAPEHPVQGRVINIYGGVDEAGKHAIISLNRGQQDGLEVGHVLALYRKRTSIGYDDDDKRVSTAIPDERYALIFIFRVFNSIAYALVMESSKPVIVGDRALNP